MPQGEVKDQRQLDSGNSAGFGQFSSVRYRGMGFIPALPVLTAISFNLTSKGSLGMKVFIYAGTTDSIPTGSELYSFTITNANLSTGLTKYTLPTPLSLTVGNQYCFYLAPWNTETDSYSDDYRDLQWKNSDEYSAGKPIVNNNGTWAVSDSGNLDMHFETYGKATDLVNTVATLRPNGAGFYNDFDSYQGAGGATSFFDAVDDVTADDDSTYVYEPRNARKMFLALPDNQIPAGATINKVRVWLRWMGVDPIEQKCKISIYIGSTEYDSIEYNSRKQQNYRDDFYDWSVNPNTGVAWTPTDINNLQIGIKTTSADGKKFTQLFAEVDYTTATYQPRHPAINHVDPSIL